MNSYFRSGAAALTILLALPGAALADRLVMKNGDVITGDITSITDSDVFIDPSYADEFSVSLSEVATVDMDNAVEVEFADSSKVSGQIALDGDRQVLIVDGTARPLSLAEIELAEEPDPYFDWNANVDFNLTFNDGNTDSQNTVLFGQGDVKVGDHRHYADLTFRREEQNNISVKEQDLLNYNYNWFFNKPWFIGASASYERDPIRDLDHRYTVGFLVGRDIFDDAHKFLTFSVGAGYSDEQIGGVSTDGAVGLWNLRYEHEFWSDVHFFHTQNFTHQFYGQDNTIFKTNTGFRFDLIDDLYANVSLRYDYETEPAPGRSKDDSTLAVGLGYSF